MKRSHIHSFYLVSEEDGEHEGEDEGDEIVEEDVDMIEMNYCNRNNEVVKVFNRKVFYVMKELVLMHLENVVINVFVKTVTKIGVI